MKSLTILILLSALLSAGEPEAPIDEARVRACIEKLSANDFEIRENATAELKSLGPRAWPALEPFLKSGDRELTARLRMIAADFGLLLAEQRELAAALIKKLESEETKDRIQGFDGLLMLGPAGIKLVQQSLSGAGAEPKLIVDVPPSVAVNTEVKFNISLINENDKVFWVNQRSRSIGISMQFDSPFGEPRNESTPRSGGGRSMSASGGWSHPIARYAAITKTSKPIEHTMSRNGDRVGIHKGNISRSIPNGEKLSAKLPGTDQTVDLLIGNELKETRKKPSQDFKLFVLPDFSKSQKSALALNVETTREGASLMADVSLLLNLKHRTALTLEKNLARYAWYVFLSGDKPVQWGSWNSVLSAGPNTQDLLDEKTLQAGQTAHWKLKIALPDNIQQPVLLIGYETEDTSIPNDEILTENELETPRKSNRKEFTGKLYLRQPL